LAAKNYLRRTIKNSAGIAWEAVFDDCCHGRGWENLHEVNYALKDRFNFDKTGFLQVSTVLKDCPNFS
jgi:hypothetical protein